MRDIVSLSGERGNIKSSLDYCLKLKIPKDNLILDIGCRYGSLVFNLYRLGYKNVFGIDRDRDAIAIGKNRYDVVSDRLIVYPGKHLPFDDNSFDTILMFDVIEHIPKVDLFMKKEVYRVLKKGGLFIYQTPNKYMNIPWEIIHKKSVFKWRNYHCSLQTVQSLREILLRVGFSSIVIEKYNIVTEHNRKKLQTRLGFLGSFVLNILRLMPLNYYPNLWGNAKKI